MNNVTNAQLCDLLCKMQAVIERAKEPVIPTVEQNHPYTIGKPWFFRTVTHHLTGEIKWVGEQEILLKGGTVLWVADDGRFTDALKTRNFSETEVYGDEDVVIGRGSIIDATELHTLPDRVQK